MMTLISILVGLFSAAMVVFILLPLYANTKNLSRYKITIGFMVLVLGISSGGLYYFLGDSQGVNNKILWEQLEAEHQQNQALYVPANFIESLQAQLDKQPDNGMNWVLLGQIYFTAQDYHDAAAAFHKALVIYPKDPDILIEYATALYLAGENEGENWNQLIAQVSALSPQTVTSLSLLANVAFINGDKAQAINYWQMILSMTPPNSPFYQTVQDTIDQANK